MLSSRIVVTGAAGLVGQNLILLLKERGCKNIVAIDKHDKNVEILKKLNPDMEIIKTDLSEKGPWMDFFRNCDIAITLHAQIAAKDMSPFEKNNIDATENVLEAARKNNVTYLIHASSSVINSVVKDKYTTTKKLQESIVLDSKIPFCILRPTLMFGWFDRKNIGWLSRFMKKTPLFPIPGDGKFMRQPLYVKDFCRVILEVMEHRPVNRIYDISGKEQVDYIDIIRSIKKNTRSWTPIVCLPYKFFYFLLKTAETVMKDPPFTTEQLEALTAGDEFNNIPWEEIFEIEHTPFEEAMEETFQDGRFSGVVLKY